MELGKVWSMPFFRLAGTLLALLGGTVMLGRGLQSATLLQILPDSTPMVFSTALCFALAGGALLWPSASSLRAQALTVCGSIVAAIAALVLAEHVFQADLGVDWPSLHAWHKDANPKPGRMAAAAAVAFLMSGVALVLIPRVRRAWQTATVRALALATGTIGALGLIGYFVGANLLFAQYRHFGIAPSTAAGLLLLAFGMRVYWRQFDWGRARFFVREDDRITFASAAVLGAVALGAVIATFSILQATVQTQVRDHIHAALANRSAVFQDLIRMHELQAQSAALRPAAARNLRVIRAGGDDGSNLANLQAVVESFLKIEISAIAYHDADGRLVAGGGSFVQAPAISVPLSTRAGAELLWNDGLMLRHRFPMHDSAGKVGEVRIEQALPVLTEMVRTPAGSGATWDLGLCVRRDQQLQCFPQRLNAQAFATPLVNVAGELLPMTRALRGETGTTITRDYRAQNVLAAYGPVGDLGLGMVVKVDTAEVFAPIREQLLFALGVLLAVVAAGTLLLRGQVRPLATRMQGALEERAAGLHRAQQMSKLAHVITLPDGAFDTWSETLPELIGVEAARVPRSTREWLNILHPEDQALFRRTAIEAGIKGTRADVEYRLRRSDGAWIHVQQTMEPLGGESPADSKHRWFNTLQDVTERKSAEEKIKHLNRVYAVLSGVNSMIVRVSERGELFREACRIAIEAGKFRLVHIAMVDPEARRIRTVACAGDDPEFAQRDRPLGPAGGIAGAREGTSSRAIRSKRSVIANDIRPDSKNMAFPEEALKRGYHSAASFPLIVGGNAIGALSMWAAEPDYFDAQEVKLLEELAGDIAFAVEHLDLDQRVKQRTAELNTALDSLRTSEAELEQRVQHRTAELESANHELEAFSYSVSHDLRAPLRHIDGFAQMLREDCAPALDASGMRYLEVITGSVKQMGQLIDDLLLFSKMGRVEMHQAQVSMDGLVTEAVKMQESEIGSRTVEWAIEPLPEVRGDRSMLRQVWANLLSNSVKYTRGRPVAKVSIGYSSATGEFHVRDNGAGFDMTYADKLFGVFQRLHRTEEFEGTGVGLANVRRIITRHGGRIRAEGKVNEGANFYFSFPPNQRGHE